jgi:glycosyl transferase family 1
MPALPIPVHFVLDPAATRWDDIAALDERAVEREPGRFVGGRNSWIAQSYVRLRTALAARGWQASAGPGFVPGALCIAHRDDVNRFLSAAHASFLVVVRADRAPVRACDFSIVQNGLGHAERERFIPLWPQPGLRARDRARGERIERIAYHGRTGTSPSWFGDARFRRALAARGVDFAVKESAWEDYRAVDLALAARDELPEVLATKPATKLYNAWLAGAPLLASPEPAYTALRRRLIDFIEVRGPSDVLRSIDLLRANPALYAAMVANGLERAREFTVASVRARWLELLDGEVVPAFLAWRESRGARRTWFLAAMAQQKLLSRMHRLRCMARRWQDWPAARRYPSARPTTSPTLPESPSAARIDSSAVRA